MGSGPRSDSRYTGWTAQAAMQQGSANPKRFEAKRLLHSADGRAPSGERPESAALRRRPLGVRRVGQVGHHSPQRLGIDSSRRKALAVLQDDLGGAEFWAAEFADRAFPNQRPPVYPSEQLRV